MGVRRFSKYSFQVFLPLIPNVLSRAQHHTIPTTHSVKNALLPTPQTLDDCPEVILHGLTEHFPRSGLFLGDCRSPTGQKGSVRLVL